MNISRWAEKEIGARLIRLHDPVYQKTNGRIGHRFPGVPPTLLLHTIGAKTGLPRTHALTYARDKDAYLIVASTAVHSATRTGITTCARTRASKSTSAPKRFEVTARRVMPEDSDYQRLWQIVNKNNFNQYNAISTERRGQCRSSN